MSAGYTIPILVTGLPTIDAAVSSIQNLDSKTNTFANNQVSAANRIAGAAKEATKAIQDERVAIEGLERQYAASAASAKGKGKKKPKAQELPADLDAFKQIVDRTAKLLTKFDGFSFTRLEKEYQRSTMELHRYNEALAITASTNRINLNAKTALLAATEREIIANQNAKAAIAAFNAEQHKETALLQLQYEEFKKATTITERRTAAVVGLRNELNYSQSLEGRVAEQLKLAIRLAQEDAVAKDKRKAALANLRTEYDYAISLEGRQAERIKFDIKLAQEDAVATDKRKASLAKLREELEYAQSFQGKLAEQLKYQKKLEQEAAIATDKRAEALRKLRELQSNGPAAEDARLAYRTKLAEAAAIADLKLAEARRVLAALQTPGSQEREAASVARQTSETQKLLAAKERLAALKDPTSLTNQNAALEQQIRAQQELLRLRAATNVSPNDRREIATLTEKEKLEQERARLLARSTREFRALEAEVNRLRRAEEKAIGPTKSLSMHLNIANQAAAALRSSIYGMGASFGVFTSSTVLVAASVYAVSRAFREGIVAALDYEQKLAALAAMASRSSSLSPEYTSDKERLNQAALDASLSSKYSTVEVADAMRMLALAGLDVDQSIKATLPTMRLATVGQLGFAEAADIATNVMMGFGKSVEQLPEIIDVLAKAATESNTDVTQLGNAMSYAAPIANAFGVSLQYTAAAMEVLANAGIKSSRAGTGMRRVFVSLFTPTQKITEAVEGFGITLGKVGKEGESLESLDFSVGKLIEQAGGAQEAQRMLEEFYIATAGGTKNLQLLRETVGVYALPAMTQLVKSVGLGTKSIQAFADSLEDIEGTAEQQSAKMLDNLKDVWSQVGAAGDVLSAKLYDEEKSGLRTMLEQLLAIARSLAQSSKVAAPFTAAIKALGAAVLKVVGILVSLKLGMLAFSTVYLVFAKTTAAVKGLGLALDWAKGRYAAMGVAATAAAAATQAAAGAEAVGAAGKVGLLASLGLSGGGLAVGAVILGGIVASLIYAYKQLTGIGEAVDAVSDAFTTMKSEVEAYNQNLQQQYDMLAGGGLIKLYEERSKLELDMLDTSGKTVEQTKLLKEEYAKVNKEIAGAHETLRKFSTATMVLNNAKLRDSATAERDKAEAATKAIAEAEAKLAKVNKWSSEQTNSKTMQGRVDPSLALRQSTLEKEIQAQRGILFISEQLAKSYEAQYETAEQLQKVLSEGTALDHAQKLGVMNASLNKQIQDQIKLVEDLRKQHEADKSNMGLREQYKAADDALAVLQQRQQAVAEQEKLAQATVAAGAVSSEKILAQADISRQRYLDKQKLINGSEEYRAEMALAAATAERDAAYENVRQLEAVMKALANLMAVEKDAVRQTIYHQALLDTNSSLVGSYKTAGDALEAYNTALKTSDGLKNKSANADGKLIKSAAELHEAQQSLAKDLADFKRGFTELNGEILSKGVEVFADMTQHALRLSGALKQVTLSGAEVAGIEMPSNFTPAAGKYSDIINAKGAQYGVDPELIRRIVKQESNFNPNAVSPAGAAGLMQLMPGTAKDLGISIADRLIPELNIDAGVRYIKQQLDSSGGNVSLALAKYNAGPGAVQKYGGIPPYGETRDYVAKITKGYGTTSSEEQVLANTNESKSITILVKDKEALAKAEAQAAEQAVAQYNAQSHLQQLMQAEITTYAEAKDAYAEADYWQKQITANKELDVTQTKAASAAMDKANSTWKAYTAAHQASLAAEEQSIRKGELKTIQVARSSEEIEKLKEQYVEGDAALKDYNMTLAINDYLLGKGALTAEQYAQNMSDATRKVAQAKGEYESFFDSLRYDAKDWEKIGTGAMTSFRDSISEALASGKMDFEKFLSYLRDAAAKFAADKVLESLFKPASSEGGSDGGLLSGVVGILSKVVSSYLAPGSSAGSSSGVLTTPEGMLISGLPAAHASGGIVAASLPHGVYSSPTLFPMRTPGHHAFASGTGLLGEAGPEAVLPLTRSAGKLGVNATGVAPQVNVTVNTLPGQTANVKQDRNGLTIDIVEKALASRIANGGSSLSAALETSYAGIKRQGR